MLIVLYTVYFFWVCFEIEVFTGLSVDGDSQGVERLFGALSAHMWPGMILKSGDKIAEPSLPEREEGFILYHFHLVYNLYVLLSRMLNV